MTRGAIWQNGCAPSQATRTLCMHNGPCPTRSSICMHVLTSGPVWRRALQRLPFARMHSLEEPCQLRLCHQAPRWHSSVVFQFLVCLSIDLTATFCCHFLALCCPASHPKSDQTGAWRGLINNIRTCSPGYCRVRMWGSMGLNGVHAGATPTPGCAVKIPSASGVGRKCFCQQQQ